VEVLGELNPNNYTPSRNCLQHAAAMLGKTDKRKQPLSPKDTYDVRWLLVQGNHASCRLLLLSMEVREDSFRAPAAVTETTNSMLLPY
jgi:hypothetical protein